MSGPLPGIGLQLGISPVSSAANDGDMSYTMPNFSRGAINFGSAGGETPLTGLIRDGAIVVVLFLATRFLWSKIK